MRHRNVGELMTRDVIRVRNDAPFKEIVRLLSDRQVTAVPVVDADHRLLGVVSEGDLLRKTSDQAAAAELLPVPDADAWERAKAEGTRADELMSAPAVCVTPEWTVVEAARLMEVQNVKRLPVVDDRDRLVGIVSRRDLLSIFLRGDEAIRDEIVTDVLVGTLHQDPSAMVVAVRDGQVTLSGSVPYKGMIPAIVRMCSTVDGVVSVSEHLDYGADDTL
ncbi:CBS domain-containing protein [Streptomyces sp. SCSIO 30461]|uniref:CBS domain-containing protein n=1 Tax=Streptomyces sp. SCSIO 30461 TaxID=3118085 RepID=UPI0030D13369